MFKILSELSSSQINLFPNYKSIMNLVKNTQNGQSIYFLKISLLDRKLYTILKFPLSRHSILFIVYDLNPSSLIRNLDEILQGRIDRKTGKNICEVLRCIKICLRNFEFEFNYNWSFLSVFHEYFFKLKPSFLKN